MDHKKPASSPRIKPSLQIADKLKPAAHIEHKGFIEIPTKANNFSLTVCLKVIQSFFKI